MSAPPTPTRRSFLFTDIESSTRLWEHFPEAMLGALEQHDHVVHGAVTANGGAVMVHTGDGVVASFAHASSAVAAALQARRLLAEAEWTDVPPLAVRMGIHTGPVLNRDNEFFGWALNVGSRLHALAHGGQVLVSGSAYAELGDDDPGLHFDDLGIHRLRDIAEPLRVYAVRSLGSPPSTLGVRGNSGPVASALRPLTTFVGREAELAWTAAQVRAQALVTVVGLSGVGKTRLALEVMDRIAPEFPDGVALCELDGVEDGDVGPSVAKALGVERRTMRTAQESVAEWLQDRSVLLIVDNCEDVAAAVAPFVLDISRRSPRSRVLCTSREPLDVVGEHVVRLQPFDVTPGPVGSGNPSGSVGSDGSGGSTDDAVELFLARARSAGGALGDDETTRRDAAAVCAAVAGLPLAIELAASSAGSLSLPDIADAVRSGDLPAVGTTALSGRSLSAALGVAFDRLTPVEQAAFTRAAVFVGSFDRDAFSSVTMPGAANAAVLVVLRRLVDRSLIVSESRAGRTRFRMLEPVRDFARSRIDADDRAEAELRFADHYLVVARQAADLLRGPDEVRWVAQLDLDFDNLRAVHHDSVSAGAADHALGIVAALWDFAFMRMRSEIFDWGESAVAVAAEDHPELPLVLGIVALGGWIRDNPTKSARFIEQSLRLEQRPGASPTLPVRLAIINAEQYGHHTPYDIRVVMGELMELSQQSGSPYWQTNVDVIRSLGHSFSGRTEPAVTLAGRALASARASQNPSTIAWALFGRGVSVEHEDPEHAEVLLDDALMRARSVDNRWVEAMCGTRLASLRRTTGSWRDAMASLLELLETWERAGHRAHVWSALRLAALCLAEHGDEATAVVLHELTESAALTLPQLPDEARDFSAALARIRAAAGEDQMRRWATRAKSLDQTEALRMARERLTAAIG